MVCTFRCHHIVIFFSRENEEDKEMADFLKSKIPRNINTGAFAVVPFPAEYL